MEEEPAGMAVMHGGHSKHGSMDKHTVGMGRQFVREWGGLGGKVCKDRVGAHLTRIGLGR